MAPRGHKIVPTLLGFMVVSIALKESASVFPVVWSPALMCQRNDPEFFMFDLIREGVRETTQWETPGSATPDCAQFRIARQKIQRSFELCNEGHPECLVCAI